MIRDGGEAFHDRAGRAWRARLAASALTAACTGCVLIPLPAETTVARTGQVLPSTSGIAVAVLVAADDGPKTPGALGRDMVDCITRGLSEAAPEVRIVSRDDFYRSVFKLRPEEVRLRQETISTLFSRPDIKQRAADAGLSHLIFVSGTTVFDESLAVVPVPPILLLGAMERTRSTRLAASILDLARVEQVARIEVTAEGHQTGFMILPLVVGWGHTTEASSCKALGAAVVRLMGESMRR